MCSRVLYRGGHELVITGRTMDWYTPTETDLWAMPRGIDHEGRSLDHPFRWTSTRGSVVASGFDAATVEGLNESGLAAHLLYLSASTFPVRNPTMPGMCISIFAQWVLDCFDTVAEVVDAMASEPFQLTNATIPGGKPATAHLAVSDATGDSAVFELLDGELVIHHGPRYVVMTNDPPYDQQLALCAYFDEVGTEAFLPGTERPADRFVRASHYLDRCPSTDDGDLGAAYVFAIVRNVSVPFEASDPQLPNVAPTNWRTAIDHRSLRYFFESTLHPNVFWVDLLELDLSEGAPARRLVAESGPIRAGEVSSSFAPTPMLTFLPEAPDGEPA